jgi:hypothetical protein
MEMTPNARIISFTTFLVPILLFTFTFNLLAASVSYKGQSKCGTMQVEIYFTYDVSASTINNFKTKDTCVEGKSETSWAVKDSIKVNTDGSFSYKDKYGNGVNGRITSNGKASGELLEGSLLLKCADEKFHKTCTQWTAHATDN